MIKEKTQKIFTISRYTLLDLIKSKVLVNTLILGGFICLVSYIAFSFTYGVPERIAIDVGLGALSFSAVAISLFMGVNLLSKEMESKTIYMILSRPVSRLDFFLGKYFGMFLFIAINIIILSMIILSLYFVLGGNFDYLIPVVISFSFLESMIVLSLVLLFSLMTNVVLSTIYTISIYVFGHAISTVSDSIFVKKNVIINTLFTIYESVFPVFSKLNFKDFLLHSEKVPVKDILFSYSYAICYIIFLNVLILFIFARKNLD